MTGSWILHKHLHNEPIRTLLIRPTGGGKTLVYITIAKCIGGVTLCISPLLALGADQFRKVFRFTTGNPRIAVAHLDELTDKQLEDINAFLKDRYDSRCSLIL
jgi:Superfamily II DNA helicase